MHNNASISSINKKVLTVYPKWHYSVPYLVNFSNKPKGNDSSFKLTGIPPMVPVLNGGPLEGISARNVKFFSKKRNYLK